MKESESSHVDESNRITEEGRAEAMARDSKSFRDWAAQKRKSPDTEIDSEIPEYRVASAEQFDKWADEIEAETSSRYDYDQKKVEFRNLSPEQLRSELDRIGSEMDNLRLRSRLVHEVLGEKEH